MAQQVHCPICRRRLTVADAAPNWLTCPNCLAKIDRSAFAQLQTGGAVAAQPALSTTAVDAEASRDANIGLILLWVLGALAFLGALHLAINSGSQGWGCIAVGVVMVAVLVLLLMRTSNQAVARANQPVREGVRPPPLPRNVSGSVLGYSPARRGHELVSMGAFAAGFLLALLVCGGGVVLLGVTAGSGRSSHGSGIYLMIVMAAVVTVAVLGGTVGGKPGWRGFGLGVACGLGLGMLALGPCGFCYLLSLQ